MYDMSEHQIDCLRETFAACLARRTDHDDIAYTSLDALDAAAVEALDGAPSLITGERANVLDDGARAALDAGEVSIAWTLAQVARWAASQQYEAEPEVALDVEAYAWDSIARCEKELGEKGLVVEARNLEVQARRSLVEVTDGDLSARHDLAVSLETRGDALSSTDAPIKASLDDYSDAAAILEQLIDEVDSEEDFRERLAGTLTSRAIAYRNLGRLDEALSDETAVIELHEALVSDYPDAVHHRQRLAHATWQRAATYGEMGQFDHQYRDDSAAIGLLQNLVDGSPDEVTYRDDLADAHVRRSATHSDLGDADGALDDLNAAVEIVKVLIAEGHDLAGSLSQYARILSFRAEQFEDSGQLDNALTDLSSAVAALRRVVQTYPDNSRHQGQLARLLSLRAELLGVLGQFDRALADNDTAIAILKGVVGDPGTSSDFYLGDLASALGRRADVLRAIGHLQDAVRDQDAEVMVQEAVVRNHPGNVVALSNLAHSLTLRALSHAEAGHVDDAIADADAASALVTTGSSALFDLERAIRIGTVRAKTHLSGPNPNLDAVLDSLELAIQSVEHMRRGRTTAHERELIFAEHRDLYPWAIQVALSRASASPADLSSAYVERAYAICLLRTARGLVDGLGSGPDDELADLTPEQRGAVDEVDRRIADLRRMIVEPELGDAGLDESNTDSEGPQRLPTLLRPPDDPLAEYARLEGERQRLVGRLGVDAPTVDQVRSALRAGELLLDGFIGDDLAGWFVLRQGQPVRWIAIEREGLITAKNSAMERWQGLVAGGAARSLASGFRRRVEDLCAALLPTSVVEEVASARGAFVTADLVLHNLPLLRGFTEALKRAMSHSVTLTTLPGGGLLVALRADRPQAIRELDVLTVGADIHGDLELVDRAVRMTAEQYRDLTVRAHPTHEPNIDRFIGDDLLNETTTTYLFQYDGHAGVPTLRGSSRGASRGTLRGSTRQPPRERLQAILLATCRGPLRETLRQILRGTSRGILRRTAGQDVALYFPAHRRGNSPGESRVLGREIQVASKMRMEVVLILGCFSSFVDGAERSEYLGLGRALFQRCRARALVLCLYAVPDAACAWYSQELHRIWREPGTTLAEAHARALDSLADVTPSQLAEHGIDLQGKPRALRGSNRADDRKLSPEEPAFAWHQVAAFTLLGDHDLPAPGSWSA